ncbi:MAG: TrkA family potassium uptake protein [Clostridia bacterium]|nr:TrkA family potassium uptake protein [Clostridia bacterium]
MKSVLVIGMGQFGQLVGDKLMKLGNEVMIVDRDENIINALAPKYTNAVITNCINPDNVKSLDVASYDACVVTIADDFQSSLEITSVLKDLGAKYVVSKANTDIQRKFLFRVGADEVLYPNRDVAEKLAVRLNAEKVYDYIELDATCSIFEIAVPDKWIGKTIREANPRADYDLNILTIKKDNKIVPSITPDTVFEVGDKMVVFGDTEKILAFTNKKK